MTIVYLGNTEDIDNGPSSLENVIRCVKITTPDHDGVLNSITAKIVSTAAFTVKCAVYVWTADNNLGAYIGTTEEKNIGVIPATWITFNFAAPVPLVENTSYYIVVWGNSAAGTLSLRRKLSSGINKETINSVAYGAWPDPMTGEAPSTSYFCLYGAFEYREQTAGFTSTTYDFTTNQCNITNLSFNDAQDMKTWNFWKQSDIQSIATGLQTKNITLEGTENVDPYTVMAGIDSAADAGDVITLFGMKNTDLNTTWLIESFRYHPVSKDVIWSLTLEKYYA